MDNGAGDQHLGIKPSRRQATRKRKKSSGDTSGAGGPPYGGSMFRGWDAKIKEYGSEFLYAVGWTFALVPYDQGWGLDQGTGRLLSWLFLALYTWGLWMIVYPHTPHVIGAFSINQLIRGKGSAWNVMIRMLMQALGGVVGYSMVSRWFPALPHVLITVWERIAEQYPLKLFIAGQVVIYSLTVGFQIRRHRTLTGSPDDDYVISHLARSGQFLYLLLFPIIAPSFAVTGILMYQNGYQLSSFASMGLMIGVHVLSAFLGELVYEMFKMETARGP